MPKWDVIFYDAVGGAYTGRSLRTQGLGGSEQAVITVAEGLAERGLKVLVANGRDGGPVDEYGVRYVGLASAISEETRALVNQRYGVVPQIKYELGVCSAHDIPGDSYNALSPDFVRRSRLVAVSKWQAGLPNLRDRPWLDVTIIPVMLQPEVHELALRRHRSISFEAYRQKFGWNVPNDGGIAVDPHRFGYFSAAIKGLRETLAMWESLSRDMPPDARLFVANPGHDVHDLPKTWPAGVVSIGSVPNAHVASIMATCAGLFYVNTFPETLCMTGVMAEALGLRLHVLCKYGFGGMREAITSPLITDDEHTFRENFVSALTARLDDTKLLGRPLNYTKKYVVDEWYRVVTSSITTSLLVESTSHPVEPTETTSVGSVSSTTELTPQINPASPTIKLAISTREQLDREAFERARIEANKATYAAIALAQAQARVSR